MGIWIRILLFVSTTANSCGANKREAWKECNRRLFNYYRALAPQLPDNFREMEPLFLAAICGCNAGLFREALHEVYIARIQRGDAFFAANVLGARGALLSVLVHFFEHGRWGSPAKWASRGRVSPRKISSSFSCRRRLYLTITRGYGAPEAAICYERAESLCHSLNRPRLLFMQLLGQVRYTLMSRPEPAQISKLSSTKGFRPPKAKLGMS